MSQSKNPSQLNESLSALVDDEASEIEVHRILTAAQQDAGVRERWHRYQLARAAMKGDVANISSTALADRVREAIADIDFDEVVPGSSQNHQIAPPRKAASRWKHNTGRVAIAASVAVAVLLGSQQMKLAGIGADSGEEFAQQAQEPAPAAAPSNINIPTINVQNVSGGDSLQRSRLPQGLQYSPNIQQQQLQDEQIRRYIRQLMLEHAEHSAQNSGSGLLPYARVPAEEER